ncbi:hypothetical protein BSKO_12151 [Bryopsis sp. KO-2023]|nr:hypothetical protein BSKO_12151 [Bryopsis sp. KO-2023]
MEEARARRDRLKALREAAALGGEGEGTQNSEMPVLKFRNYALKDENIEHTKVAPARPILLGDAGKAAGDGANPPKEEVVIDVAPKKANWDLKRNVEKKLQKLERATQRALLEIMQDMEKKRFEEEGGIADEEDAELK